MHPVRTTLATTTNPLVLVALVWTLLWGYGATQIALPGEALHHGPLGPDGADSRTRVLADVGEEPVWESSWSRRFPGCVALVLWPQHESPRAVVTRTAEGRLAQVAPAVVGQQPGRVVGACR